MSITVGRFQKSKVFQRFYVAGVAYHDAALVLNDLKAGQEVNMVLEPDNPHDHDAIALYVNDVMIGYVPASQNGVISQLAYFGHTEIFDAHVLHVDPEAPTYKQIEVGIYIVPKKEKLVF